MRKHKFEVIDNVSEDKEYQCEFCGLLVSEGEVKEFAQDVCLAIRVDNSIRIGV